MIINLGIYINSDMPNLNNRHATTKYTESRDVSESNYMATSLIQVANYLMHLVEADLVMCSIVWELGLYRALLKTEH